MLSTQSQAKSDHGDEIFLAFKEWLQIQEARHGSVAPGGGGSLDSQRDEFHRSPGIAPVEPSIGMYARRANVQTDGISRAVGRKARISHLCLWHHLHRSCWSRIGLAGQRL